MLVKRLSLIAVTLLAVYLVWKLIAAFTSEVGFTDVATVAGLIIALLVARPTREGNGVRIPTGSAPHSPDSISLSGVVIGGVLGGGLSALVFSLCYYKLDNTGTLNPLVAIPEITVALGIAFAALVIGTRITVSVMSSEASVGGARWFIDKELRGSLIGCVISGLIVGIPLGWHFGKYRDIRPFTPPEYLIGTLVPGCVIACVVFLLFEKAQNRGDALRISVVGLLAATIWGSLGYALAEAFDLETAFRELMYGRGTPVWHLIGGSIYGGFVSIFLGLTMGSTSMLARMWLAHDAPPASPAATSNQPDPSSTPFQ